MYAMVNWVDRRKMFMVRSVVVDCVIRCLMPLCWLIVDCRIGSFADLGES